MHALDVLGEAGLGERDGLVLLAHPVQDESLHRERLCECGLGEGLRSIVRPPSLRAESPRDPTRTAVVRALLEDGVRSLDAALVLLEVVGALRRREGGRGVGIGRSWWMDTYPRPRPSVRRSPRRLHLLPLVLSITLDAFSGLGGARTTEGLRGRPAASIVRPARALPGSRAPPAPATHRQRAIEGRLLRWEHLV